MTQYVIKEKLACDKNYLLLDIETLNP